MSLSEETLRKTLREMDSQLQRQKAELTMTELQLQRKMTNLKINEVIIKELKENESNPIYKSCGKLFIKTTNKSYIGEITEENKSNEEQIKGLNKKKDYLETSLNVTFDNMKKYIDL